jgi:uncharacterized protein (TIGR00369 family)
MTRWQKRLNVIQDGSSPLPPVVEYLRLGRLEQWGDGYIEKSWHVDPTFCTGDGSGAVALFGGYVGALADQAAAFAAMTVTPDDQYFRTSDLRVSFFRNIKQGLIKVRAEVVNRSKTLLHIDVQFMDSANTLVARATVVQSVLKLNEAVVQALALSEGAARLDEHK